MRDYAFYDLDREEAETALAIQFVAENPGMKSDMALALAKAFITKGKNVEVTVKVDGEWRTGRYQHAVTEAAKRIVMGCGHDI